MTQGIIIIPARLHSNRLPHKLLLHSTGLPVMAYTSQQAQLAVAASRGLLREVVVACDDPQLIDVAESSGVCALLTSATHSNGTSRIAEAMRRSSLAEGISFVLNVLGDQPELQPDVMIQIATDLINHPQCEMATAAVEFSALNTELYANSNVVKVAIDASGYATNFWRERASAISQPWMTQATTWYRHVGIYAYRIDFLQQYAAVPPSAREQAESLEQLRALEMGVRIFVSLISPDQAGGQIDTPDDYAEFVERVRKRKAASP